MAVTVATSPTYPTVGDEVTLSISGIGVTPSDDTHEFALTSVPPTSALTTGLLVDETSAAIDTFTPDVAGDYGVTAYRYAYSATASSFDGDSAGESPRTLVEVQSATVSVYELVALPLYTKNGHGSLLRLGISGTTVRAATLVDPLTEVSRLAAEDATVAASLAALVGVAISALGPDLQTGTNELLTAYAAHRILTAGAVHPVADSYNVVGRDAAKNSDEAVPILARIALEMTAHLTQAGITGIRWHGADDTKNVPLAQPPSDRATATVALCDLRFRVYNRHRTQIASPATHGAADTTNTLATSITPLEALVRDFFDFIAASTPTTPTGEPAGTLAAAALYGFTKVT